MTTGISLRKPGVGAIIILVVGLAFGVALPLILQAIGSTMFIATEFLIFAIFAVGFNLLLGFTGILSFGHAAWLGIASYACAIFQVRVTPQLMVLPMLFSIVFTTGIAALVGKLIMKPRGIYFAYVTIAIGQLVYYIVFRWTALTGGEGGMGGIERLPLLGFLDLGPEYTFYLFVFVVFIALLVLMRVIVNSPFGRVLQAIRENRTRVMFLGYDVKNYEYASFVISVFYAAVAGSLYAYLMKYVFPESLHWSVSGEVVIMTLIGGMQYIMGPVLGAFVVTFLKDFISTFTDRWMIVLGAIFVIFVLCSPEGILGLFTKWARKSAGRRGQENAGGETAHE